jgi:nitroreductase
MAMTTRRDLYRGPLGGAAFAAEAGAASTGRPAPAKLPPPRRDGGMPLFSALDRRCSAREFSDRAIPPQTLSDLLWAAFGVNRADGGRTAPYARHIIMIDIYVATAKGVWLYDPAAHALLPRFEEDIRAATAEQEFAHRAPLELVYVAHGERMADATQQERQLDASVDAGFIGQNVYLCCASEGLATVFRGLIDAGKIARLLKLPDDQFVAYAQSVGFPA